MRAALESWIHCQWSRRGAFSALLWPLSRVFLAAARRRRQNTAAQKLPVPVIVVGNIYVGGTGKTPVTIALAQALAERGWHPGIISRGYLGERSGVCLVDPEHGQSRETGDEPLLMARACRPQGIPVAVGQLRVLAAQALLDAAPQVDVIVSDDGMQHYRLARDMEIAVVGSRGIGNGLVLPAGPLREPPQRLAECDAIVLNGTDRAPVDSVPSFVAESDLTAVTPLAGGSPASIDDFAARCAGRRVAALAGIATPSRFFGMLRAHGIEASGTALPDHFDFRTDPFPKDAEVILITAKDAVKCAEHPEFLADSRIHVASLGLTLDPRLIDLIAGRLAKLRGPGETP